MSARTKGWAIALLYLPRHRHAAANGTAAGMTFSSCLRVCTRPVLTRKFELAFGFAAEAPHRRLTEEVVLLDCFKIAQRCADRRRTGSPRQPWPEESGERSAAGETSNPCSTNLRSEPAPALAARSATKLPQRTSARTMSAAPVLLNAASGLHCGIALEAPNV
jgi:hypothetical protein